MRKKILLIIMFLSLFILSSCPAQEIKGIEEILNTYFDDFLYINPYHVYQEDTDTIPFIIERTWITKELKSLHIKGNTMQIISAEAFGENLEKILINEEEYYLLDLVTLETTNYLEFKLFLNFQKNSCFKDPVYSEIVKYKIIAHSFDIYINYGYEESEKQNLRFYFEGNSSYENEHKMICFNNIEDILLNTYYQELYLPNMDMFTLARENIYYPNDYSYYLSIKSEDNSKLPFKLGVRVSDSGAIYGNQTKIPYHYNGITYTIIFENTYVITDYIVDFFVYHKQTNRKIQYSYEIKASSINEVKEFIRGISRFTNDIINK